MVRKSNWKFRLSAILASLLILMTGCEAVQGYEIGQALHNNMKATSGESSGTLTFELLPGNNADLTDAEKTLLSVLRTVKINIKNAKVQDPYHISMNAEFTYSRGTIPFQLAIDNDHMVFNIEGASKPVVFHNSRTTANPIEALLTDNIKSNLQKQMTNLMPEAAKFLINSAPNPRTISLTQVSEQVHNETLDLQKLHAEIYGSELQGLAKKFIGNILADEKGLKELIGQLYDILIPVIKTGVTAFQAQMNPLPSDSSSMEKGAADKLDLVNAYLDNKTLVVEFVFTTIQQGLKYVLKEFDQTLKDSAHSPTGAQLGKLLTDEAYIKLDFFMDSDKLIRKTNYELQVPLEGNSGPVSSIKVTAAIENWNINKPVASDQIDLSRGSLEIVQTGSFKEYMFLNNLDKKSLFYKLLKEDLQVTRKTIHLTPVADADDPYQLALPFVNKDGVTMVPVRYVAEQFGAEVQWSDELQLLTLIDGATGNPIVLTIGSRVAHVGGVEVSLESPAIIRNGSTFVPLRFIAEALGAKLEWDETTNTVKISRD